MRNKSENKEENRRNLDIDYFVGLNDISIWGFILLIPVVAVMIALTKKWSASFLVGYIVLILCETVFFRTAFEGKHFQPQLLWSYKVWDIQKRQIIINIIIFIPFGLITGSLWKWKGIIVGTVVSVAIELLQLISRRGLFEFDDILHNTLGTLFGVCIYVAAMIVIERKRNKDGFQK